MTNDPSTMNTKVVSYFTRTEKILLGVCSTIARDLKLQPAGVRITFIILTFLLIPLGVIAYLGTYLIYNKGNRKSTRFALAGFLLGLPFSYYFQPDVVKHFGGSGNMFSYMTTFTQTIEGYHKYYGNGWSILYNVFISVVVFALAGVVIGYYLDRNERSKAK